MACYQHLFEPPAALRQRGRFRDLGTVVGSVISYLSDWAGRSVVDRYNERRRVFELRSLSDRTLKDIGIHRSEVLSVVYGKRFNPEDRRYERD